MKELYISGDINLEGKRHAFARVREGATLEGCYLFALQYLLENKEIAEVSFAFNRCPLNIDRATSFEAYQEDYNKQRKELEKNGYTNVEDALKELRSIKPADLTSGATTLSAAYNLCKKIMKVLYKSKDLHFTREEQEELSNILKGRGCAKYDEVNPKFKIDETRPITELIRAPKDVLFPISATSNLIETNDEDAFRYIMAKMTEGGENGWLGTWLRTQEEAEKEIEHEI